MIDVQPQQDIFCDKCDEKAIVNIPYTWDVEMQAWGREEAGYSANCTECLKSSPDNPGLILISSMPRWVRFGEKGEGSKAKEEDGKAEGGGSKEGFLQKVIGAMRLGNKSDK